MEHVFEKIIEIENRAKEIYGEAIQEKDRLKSELAQVIQVREKEIGEMAGGKIRQLTASGKKDVEEKLERINTRIQEKLSQLEAEALQNANKWEELIFSHVIGD